MQYALITPAKNEISNLEALFEHVNAQVTMPSVWIFIDDGSTDDTKEFILQLLSRESFENLRSVFEYRFRPDPLNEYALGEKYSSVVKFGLEELGNFEYARKIRFEYVALLDADVQPSPSYFYSLLQRMDEDRDLGITSGGRAVEITDNGETEINFSNKNHAIGCARIWRRDCLDQTGYYISISQDAVSEARAIMMGWNVESYHDISISMRKRGSKFGFRYYGRSAYARFVPFYYVLAAAVKYAAGGRLKDSGDYVGGYLWALFRKEPRITDELAKSYFRSILKRRWTSRK